MGYTHVSTLGSNHCAQSSTMAHWPGGVLTLTDLMFPLMVGSLSFVMSDVYVDVLVVITTRVFAAEWARTSICLGRSNTRKGPIWPTSICASGIARERPLKTLDAS